MGSFGVNEDVQNEAESMMSGKSHTELVVLEKEIQQTLAVGGPVDIEVRTWATGKG